LNLKGVIPAKAGIQLWFSTHGKESWTPAFAGVTPVLVADASSGA